MEYYIISALLIVAVIIIATVSFERHRRDPRELALMGAFAVLAVLSRIVFAAVPFFKPVAGVVIIAGIGLGGAPGLAIGALAMLVSDLMFGEGPWLPFQMMAFGLTGLLFGALADGHLIPRKDWSLKQRIVISLVSGLCILLITGPLLDTTSVLTSSSAVAPGSILAIYTAGIAPNAILAIATVVTVFLFGPPILGLIDRIRAKYGFRTEL